MKKETEKMDQKNFSKPLSLAKVQVTDAFWKKEMELVRTEVIPYQTNLFRSNIRWILLRHCRRMAKWTEDFMASCSRIPILPNGWRQLRTP